MRRNFMANTIHIILYQCKKRLNKGLKRSLIDENQEVEIINQEVELTKYCQKNKNNIIVYDGLERNKVKKIMEKMNQPYTYILFLLSNREAKKFNFRKNQNPRILYFSSPSSLVELSQLIFLIYSSKRLAVLAKEHEDILKAYEQASELSRQELINAYKSIEAHENLRTMSEKDLAAIRDSLAAWEKVAELSRNELIEYEKEREAYSHLIEFVQNENMFKDKVIKAWEEAMELGRQELIKMYEQLKKDICDSPETDSKTNKAGQ